ncbi:hypothetical protein AG4045_013873 [Apium graveolens]|uniref:Remorin C-terminal domain-containing protein n=1 Tax=Apium graveolens TaxID=4045 RepID=A0A6L5BB35_APIGR|nr:hypothetical protein AG4045_013873 [Apium graveolens]
MEYERIHKVQTGLISPTKLRMKLMLQQRKNEASHNSTRTPPSKLQDIEFVENSLLASNDHSDEQVCSIGNASFNQSSSSSPSMRSVSMRDIGTEMTPIPSQEPSRTATPVGATTPLRSPAVSSLSSTPRVPSTSRPAEYSTDFDLKSPAEPGSREWSTQELRIKTRKEIVALGVQLGKTKIAAWASRGEKDKNASAAKHSKVEELRKIEFQKRAAAWEEVEKSKRAARFRREDIKIQAWESQQKAKLDAEMRRIEAKVEQMSAHAQAKMVKKVAMAKQRSEEKRDATEAKKTK